jgi:hypothetical protein
MSLRGKLGGWLDERESERELSGVIESQLDDFEAAHADLIAECDEAERAYEQSRPDRIEERHATYMALVQRGRNLLDRARGAYAVTLPENRRERYLELFHQAVLKRLSRFAREIDLPPR